MKQELCITPFVHQLQLAYESGKGSAAVEETVNAYSRRLQMISVSPEMQPLRNVVTSEMSLYAIAYYELLRSKLAILPSTLNIAHKLLVYSSFPDCYGSEEPYVDQEVSGDTDDERAESLFGGASRELPAQAKRKLLDDVLGAVEDEFGGKDD